MPGSCGMGQHGACDAVRSVAIFHRVSETGWPVRRLGGGLSADADQPECATQPRSAGHGAAVGFVGSSALQPHHGVARRSGEPAIAGHEQGVERRRGSSRLCEDRRNRRTDLAAKPSRLLLGTAVRRAVGARHRHHGQAALRASGRRGGWLHRTNPVGHRTATTRSCCRVSVWC